MKTLIVYYSLEGSTKTVAEKIAADTGADLLPLNPVKAYPTGTVTKYLFGGRSAVMALAPELEPYQFNAENYDKIIFGTPVWASTFVPPLRTFMNEQNLTGKKIALFALSASGHAEKCFEKMKVEFKLTDSVPTLSLRDLHITGIEKDTELIARFVEEVKEM